MKTLITTLLTLFSLIAGAQNGGQFYENNVIRITYLGYDSGVHLFRVCNKQTCGARIRTKADQDKAVDVQVDSADCVIVHIFRSTPAPILFRAKAETSCVSNPDMGWLEINTALVPLSLNEKAEEKIVEQNKGIRIFYNAGYLKVATNNNLSYIQTVEVFDMSGFKRYYKSFLMSKNSMLYLHDQIRLGMNFISVRLDRSGVVYQYLIRSFY
jgi:hypothetical protein